MKFEVPEAYRIDTSGRNTSSRSRSRIQSARTKKCNTELYTLYFRHGHSIDICLFQIILCSLNLSIGLCFFP